jgi:lipopolysaccharide biosynthesis glycosyltransferase
MINWLLKWVGYECKNDRNLIYICVSGNPSYIPLLNLLLFSLVHFIQRDDIDILVITQESFLPKIRKLVGYYSSYFKGNFIIKTQQDSLVNPYTLRLSLFDLFQEVTQYSKVLYLDSDIVITNNKINDLFDQTFSPKKLQVFSECDYHTNRCVKDYNFMFTIFPLKPLYERSLIKRGVYPFNSGTFMFCPTNEMKSHFGKVNKLRKDYPHSQTDQDYLNFYFNIIGNGSLSSNSLLKKYVILINCTKSSVRTHSDFPILHFYTDMGSGTNKYKAMKEAVDAILSHSPF